MDTEVITKKDFTEHCISNDKQFEEIKALLKPIVDREVKVDWAAKQVVKVLKLLLLILSVLVAAFAVFELFK